MVVRVLNIELDSEVAMTDGPLTLWNLKHTKFISIVFYKKS